MVNKTFMFSTLAVALGSLCLEAGEQSRGRETEPAVESSRAHPLAPPETLALGRLTGVWDVVQEVRDQDGSWKPNGTAEWRWYYVLNGHAIQDDWIKPPPGQGNDETRSYGTNLRIYDAESDRWEMTWIDSNQRRVRTFTAVNDGDTVVMHGKNPSGRAIRNTFSDIRQQSFEWVQEWTFDDGASWVPVARIHATRRTGGAR